MGDLKPVTDQIVLRELQRQRIDAAEVEFFEDYTRLHPYSKIYRHLKSPKQFAVFSGLPMVNADGVSLGDGETGKSRVGWEPVNGSRLAFKSKVNQFTARVTPDGVEVTAINDQPDGLIRKGDSKGWKPQLFYGSKEQVCGNPELLPSDPINANYLNNTLQWSFPAAKRRIRLIEGRFRERWLILSHPQDDIRIKHNWSGNLPINLGYARDAGGNPMEVIVDDDEEIVPFSELAKAAFPVEIGASQTFYPDITTFLGDVGSPAISRGKHDAPATVTFLDLNNPCDVNGTITQVQIYVNGPPGSLSGCKVGIFYHTGGANYSTRSWEYLGDVPAGLSTWNVSLTCQVGDVIGLYWTAGAMDYDLAGGTIDGVWFTNGNQMPCTNVTFTLWGTNRQLSVHGMALVWGASVDGATRARMMPGTFSMLRAGSGYDTDSYSADYKILDLFKMVALAVPPAGQALYYHLIRSIYNFITPVPGTVLSATFSLYGSNKQDEYSSNPPPVVNIYNCSPLSLPYALMPSDYARPGTSPYCDTPITYAGWNTAGYNDFILNAAGIAAIGANTLIAVRSSNIDVANTEPGSIAHDGSASLWAYYSEQGAGFKPKLTVTYLLPVSSGVAARMASIGII